jgi:hypothetical protein
MAFNHIPASPIDRLRNGMADLQLKLKITSMPRKIHDRNIRSLVVHGIDSLVTSALLQMIGRNPSP